MKIKILWVMIIISELLGIFWVYLGCRRREQDIPFQFKHLFQNRTIQRSSRTQLIIEGAFLIFAGIVVYWMFF